MVLLHTSRCCFLSLRFFFLSLSLSPSPSFWSCSSFFLVGIDVTVCLSFLLCPSVRSVSLTLCLFLSVFSLFLASRPSPSVWLLVLLSGSVPHCPSLSPLCFSLSLSLSLLLSLALSLSLSLSLFVSLFLVYSVCLWCWSLRLTVFLSF